MGNKLEYNKTSLSSRGHPIIPVLTRRKTPECNLYISKKRIDYDIIMRSIFQLCR